MKRDNLKKRSVLAPSLRLSWPGRTLASTAIVLAMLVNQGCGKSSSNPEPGGAPGPVAGQAGCIPINTAQIPFTATNIRFDWANIIGGLIPLTAQSVGQMAIGGTPTNGAYNRTGVDGTIVMNITPANQAYPYGPNTGQPAPPPGAFSPQQGPFGPASTPGNYYGPQGSYGAGETANATGYLHISEITQADIAYQVQSGRIQLSGVGLPNQPGLPPGPPGAPGSYPYNGAPNGYSGGTPYGGQGSSAALIPQLCVSGIAINAGHYHETIYGGNVFLYLNNSQHGYILFF